MYNIWIELYEWKHPVVTLWEFVQSIKRKSFNYFTSYTHMVNWAFHFYGSTKNLFFCETSISEFPLYYFDFRKFINDIEYFNYKLQLIEMWIFIL